MGRKKNTIKKTITDLDAEVSECEVVVRPSVETALGVPAVEKNPENYVSEIPVSGNITETEIPVEDKVNNVDSKELAMSRAKVTRRRTYEVISELLSAVKKVVRYDSRGMEIVTEEPDLDRRKQGAELALKAFGDLKEMKASEGSTTYNTVVYQWKK